MKKVLLAFFFLLIAVFANAIVNSNGSSVQLFNFLHLTPRITIDNATFSVVVAKTPEEREKGLSGRDSLAQNSGMLFVFDHPDTYTFWMKGMKFPLDMIFIKDNKVSQIFNSVKPSDNPNDVEKPKQPVDKVLEINAGLAQKSNFKVGDNVRISPL